MATYMKFVITSQNHDKEVVIKSKQDEVELFIYGLPGAASFSGEGAIAVGHKLIEAGEKALKQSGEWKE